MFGGEGGRKNLGSYRAPALAGVGLRLLAVAARRFVGSRHPFSYLSYGYVQVRAGLHLCFRSRESYVRRNGGRLRNSISPRHDHMNTVTIDL